MLTVNLQSFFQTCENRVQLHDTRPIGACQLCAHNRMIYILEISHKPEVLFQIRFDIAAVIHFRLEMILLQSEQYIPDRISAFLLRLQPVDLLLQIDVLDHFIDIHGIRCRFFS